MNDLLRCYYLMFDAYTCQDCSHCSRGVCYPNRGKIQRDVPCHDSVRMESRSHNPLSLLTRIYLVTGDRVRAQTEMNITEHKREIIFCKMFKMNHPLMHQPGKRYVSNHQETCGSIRAIP